MSKHLTNAAYGVLDYASYPAGMLLVAPIVLRRLGASEYGLWMVATGVISAGGILASGFCDANIQRVAYLRGTGEFHLMPHTVRSILGITLILGCVLALAAWIAAPFAARRLAVSHLLSPAECLVSLRIASVLILIRGIEAVGVSTQRAFEQYRGTVQIAVGVRLFTLASAAVLALFGYRIESILVATAVFLSAGAGLQMRQLRKVIGVFPLWPRFQRQETRVLLKRGLFAWLQALGGVFFGQLDRILLGVSLGALAVAPYSLCVQFAQPISGLTASGLNFLLPHLSQSTTSLGSAGSRRILIKAFGFNLLLVLSGAVLLLIFGERLIRIWAGAAVAQNAAGILTPIVLGSALMGLSVTGTYAMQALGLFHVVAGISLAGRLAMFLLMAYLLHHDGLHGLAISRLCYGAIALLIYLPLSHRLIAKQRDSGCASSLVIPYRVQEEPKP